MKGRRLRGGFAASVVAFLVVWAGLVPRAWSQTVLPPGFVETLHVFLVGPVAIAWAPDGALWIAQGAAGQMGMGVHVYRDGVLTQALTLPNTQAGERGIHSIAVDPDYSQNGWIWVFYTADSPPHNRLSRFTNVGDTLQDEVVVLDGPPTLSSFHNGGCLAFAPDGTLFLGMGDDQQGSNTAQDTYDLRGKILHINRDGTPASGNPFSGGQGGDPRVWALGLRNPYRCACQPGTDELFIGDVGEARWEEVDIGVAGGNLGWASVEGPEPIGYPGAVYPIYSYFHDHPSGSAIIGGRHVPAGAFSPEYEGNYFYADWSRWELRRMVLDVGNTVLGDEVWATGVQGATDLAFGPDGALYYAAEAGAGVYRVEFVGGNDRQPAAVATADKDNGPAPLQVALDATGSSDPDGDPLTYRWIFGDGVVLPGPATVRHFYAQGVHQARVTVYDGQGREATSTPIRIVSGNWKPDVSLSLPENGSPFIAGQEIFFSGQGDDFEEGSLPCSQFTWEVRLHHDLHWHPFLGPFQGSCSGSFYTGQSGEHSANIWYEMRLSVSDTGAPLGPSGILSGQSSVEIFPLTARMTFVTSPLPDLALTLDTTPITPPAIVDGVVNFIRDIGAVDAQVRGTRTYRWLSWSDGGAISHEIHTPATDTVFTANFGCNVLAEVLGLRLQKGAEGSLALSWQPVTDQCLASGSVRYRIYASSTAFPSVGAGSFPNDPPFVLIGTSDTEGFLYDAPLPQHRFFLVVAVGTDGLNGPAGSYATKVYPPPFSSSMEAGDGWSQR